MKHADVLKLLFPIDLGGDFEADIETEGTQLDKAQISAEALLREMFADQAYQLLPSYERVYDLQPGADDPLQVRTVAVLDKIREEGGLSRSYFIALAARMGISITIDEFVPFMAGWGRAGDHLNDYDIIWVWRANLPEVNVIDFRAGASTAGERLGWWRTGILESILEDLKPAHTLLIFAYAT
jgi:uncharacterized protein YmfQ (DUF2313 family)